MNITRISINGRAHSYKLNSLIRKGLVPRRVKSNGKSLEFDIASGDELSAIAFLDEMCYDYQIKYRSGIKHSIDRLVSNNGLFVGIILSIMLLIISSMFIFRIDIVGTDRVDSVEVAEAIDRSGVKRYKFIHNVDFDNLEKNVLEIEGVSSVSIEVRGVRLYVHIHEEFPKEQINDYTELTPVLSQYDSIITRLVVLSGTASVKTGDTVVKGQTLIAPYYTNVDDEGEQVGERIDVKATGIVYGRVWYRRSMSIANTEIIRTRTGRYIDIANPKYLIPLPDTNDRADIPFELYEVEENIIHYNAFFPLTVTYTRYYEIEEVTITREQGDNYNEYITAMYLEIMGELAVDAVVIRYWTIVKVVDNITLIDVYLEAEQRIDDGGTFGEDYNQEYR